MGYGSSKYGESTYAIDIPIPGPHGTLVWLVTVDWNRDGSFGEDFESYYIRSLSFKRGRGSRIRGDGNGQNHPENESFTAEIYDPDGRFDVFNSTSGIYDKFGGPGFLTRISVYDTSAYELVTAFVGTLTSIEWDDETKIGTLSGSGLSRYMELGTAANVYPPCQSYSTLAYDSYFVLDATPPTPTPWNYWKGRPGGLTLDQCAEILFDRMDWGLGYKLSTTVGSLEPTYYMLDGMTGWEHLKELADGFAARVFFLRDGRVLILDKDDRDGLGTVTPPSAGALRAIGRSRTSPFESLFNRVNVLIRTHVVPMFKTPLYSWSAWREAWSNAGPIKVDPDTILDLVVDIGGGSGKVLGANYLYKNNNTYPVGDEASAYPNEDKTGTPLDWETEVGYSIVYEITGSNIYGTTYINKGNNQNKAIIRLRNYSTTKTAYFFNLKIVGAGAYEPGNSLVSTVEDSASIALNGAREMTISNRLIQTGEIADAVGAAMLAATSTRDTASVVTLGYSATGSDVVSALKNYELGMLMNFGTAGGSTSLKNFGLSGDDNLVVGQEVEWLDATGQSVVMKLTFEKMPA